MYIQYFRIPGTLEEKVHTFFSQLQLTPTD